MSRTRAPRRKQSTGFTLSVPKCPYAAKHKWEHLDQAPNYIRQSCPHCGWVRRKVIHTHNGTQWMSAWQHFTPFAK